eukprot:GHVT01038498.1.p1 GENE.GHVT01038498.1~~GHVT01038498.1.p1  ORF type:complete len:219 (-),score=38.07 GHVT01038498.1:2013-2669(-)
MNWAVFQTASPSPSSSSPVRGSSASPRLRKSSPPKSASSVRPTVSPWFSRKSTVSVLPGVLLLGVCAVGGLLLVGRRDLSPQVASQTSPPRAGTLPKAIEKSSMPSFHDAPGTQVNGDKPQPSAATQTKSHHVLEATERGRTAVHTVVQQLGQCLNRENAASTGRRLNFEAEHVCKALLCIAIPLVIVIEIWNGAERNLNANSNIIKTEQPYLKTFEE